MTDRQPKPGLCMVCMKAPRAQGKHRCQDCEAAWQNSRSANLMHSHWARTRDNEQQPRKGNAHEGQRH